MQAYWQKEFPHFRQDVPAGRDAILQRRGADRLRAGVRGHGTLLLPVDEYVYVDLGFYDELRTRFGAPGDLAQAYVIAHEFGHHVQHLLGVVEQTGPTGTAEANSVRTELQADCYAGVWAENAADTGFLEPPTAAQVGDALNAAAAVGDDRIQQETSGVVNREDVDPRIEPAARSLVQCWLSGRRPGRVRHVQGAGLIAR